MDLSPLRKFEVTGPDSEDLAAIYTLTRDVKKLGVGQVVYSAMCYEHGGMIDDGTLLRPRQGQFPLGRRRRSVRRMVAGNGGEARPQRACAFIDRPMHNVAVQGRRAATFSGR